MAVVSECSPSQCAVPLEVIGKGLVTAYPGVKVVGEGQVTK